MKRRTHRCCMDHEHYTDYSTDMETRALFQPCIKCPVSSVKEILIVFLYLCVVVLVQLRLQPMTCLMLKLRKCFNRPLKISKRNDQRQSLSYPKYAKKFQPYNFNIQKNFSVKIVIARHQFKKNIFYKKCACPKYFCAVV